MKKMNFSRFEVGCSEEFIWAAEEGLAKPDRQSVSSDKLRGYITELDEQTADELVEKGAEVISSAVKKIVLDVAKAKRQAEKIREELGMHFRSSTKREVRRPESSVEVDFSRRRGTSYRVTRSVYMEEKSS